MSKVESSPFETHHAYLGVGSNLGDRSKNLQRAIMRLDEDVRIRVEAISRFYEGEAHVLPGQDPAPDFLNAAIEISTDYTPHELLGRCLEIERALGRERGPDRWLPRTIDIDILLINGTTYADDKLTVPHPRLHERRFVLKPLADIAPDTVVPAPHNRTVGELLKACPDQTALALFSETSDLAPPPAAPGQVVRRPPSDVNPLRHDTEE
jgi:2-amino-4-hydroxy-6-hydroxymethyldihydropteridine diphosphokinase